MWVIILKSFIFLTVKILKLFGEITLRKFKAVQIISWRTAMTMNQIPQKKIKNGELITWTIPTLRKSVTSSGTWTSLLVWVLKGLNSMDGYMLCAVYMKSRCRCGCMTVYRNWNCVWLLLCKIHSNKWHLCGKKLIHLHHYKLIN